MKEPYCECDDFQTSWRGLPCVHMLFYVEKDSKVSFNDIPETYITEKKIQRKDASRKGGDDKRDYKNVIYDSLQNEVSFIPCNYADSGPLDLFVGGQCPKLLVQGMNEMLSYPLNAGQAKMIKNVRLYTVYHKNVVYSKRINRYLRHYFSK